MKQVIFLESQIPHNINDLSQKGIMNLFQNKELSLFGYKIPKIVESLNVELQNIKLEERRTDLVFLLEDESLLHLEFQTDYRRQDITRFMMYDLLLHDQHKKRKVTTIIIYASGVKRQDFYLEFNTLSYRPYVVFLEEKNGDEILQVLEEKLSKKQPFTDEDFLNLLFNCFMKSDIIQPEERVIRLIKVANVIEEPTMREMAKATTLGVIGKFLSAEQMMKISEVLIMIDPLEAMMEKEISRRTAEKVAEKIAKEVAKKVAKEKTEMARNLLEERVDIDLIARATKLTLDTIKELQLQL